jgi:outer membrane protein
MKNTALFTTTILLLGATLTVNAGDFTVGAGGASFKTPYKGFKDNNGPLLFVEYEGENFSVGSSGAHYRLLGSDDTPLNLYATLTSVGSDFKSKDSTFFAGMKDRDMSIDLGISAVYRVGDAGELSATLLHDVAGAYKGFFADVSYSHAIELGDYAVLTPSAGLSFLSKDYVDYYYGVRANEATTARAAYKGESTVTPYVGYDIMVPVSDQWSLFHSTSYAWLGSEIKNSSIVDRDNAWATTLGVAYTF